MFSENSINDLKNYVYILVDPRDERIFYVGKGTGNRVFTHENEIGSSPKNDVINEILSLGLKVKKYIVHSGLKESEAFAAETALNNILRYLNIGLTNLQTAINLTDECCLVEEYERLHSKNALTKDDFSELSSYRVAFLNFNPISRKNTWSEFEYESTMQQSFRFYKQSELPDIVFVVRNGVIYSCYRVNTWRKEKKTSGNITRTYSTYYIDKIENDSELLSKYRYSNISKIVAKTSRKRVFFL
ncbi:MAG: GIY-YIG nuclease family protein [Ruminiclostridium sp.]|nr:GIY-YIG nuclease family protein [Ruminiclostridium sp.]